MRSFTATELTRMQEAQKSAMMDTCTLLQYSEVQTSYGQMKGTWTAGPILTCGYGPTGGEEIREPGKTVVRWDAKLRLPLSTHLDLRDRIRIENRYGQPTDVRTVFEIVGPIQEGPSGFVLLLRKVEPSP